VDAAKVRKARVLISQPDKQPLQQAQLLLGQPWLLKRHLTLAKHPKPQSNLKDVIGRLGDLRISNRNYPGFPYIIIGEKSGIIG
jgi:hypothetical protein